MIHPSDHFIYPERRFLETVREAVASVEVMPDRLLLLGVQPDRLETEYGWIQRGPRLEGLPASPVHQISSFLEKPADGPSRCRATSRGLWNTLILMATIDRYGDPVMRVFPT